MRDENTKALVELNKNRKKQNATIYQNLSFASEDTKEILFQANNLIVQNLTTVNKLEKQELGKKINQILEIGKNVNLIYKTIRDINSNKRDKIKIKKYLEFFFNKDSRRLMEYRGVYRTKLISKKILPLSAAVLLGQGLSSKDVSKRKLIRKILKSNKLGEQSLEKAHIEDIRQHLLCHSRTNERADIFLKNINLKLNLAQRDLKALIKKSATFPRNDRTFKEISDFNDKLSAINSLSNEIANVFYQTQECKTLKNKS